jgi:transaldolase/glucose-6-phosphate isomerase
VFHAPPTVGGRFSALSVFGLVPAALVGVDVTGLLERARAIAIASSESVPATQNPSLQLGVTLGILANAGIDKLTFHCSPSIASFPAWLEQLVAESTGKNGFGIIPVDAEAQMDPESYGRDRVFVGLGLEGDGDEQVGARLDALVAAGHPIVHKQLTDSLDLGAEMFQWELATAAAGVVLGINPFNQPDVQLAKTLAKEAMEAQGIEQGDSRPSYLDATDIEALGSALKGWAKAHPGDYLALHAYLAPSTENEKKLQQIRGILATQLSIASTVGFGPRFLHSTGQLHKGGANNGLFLQLVDEPQQDESVPETEYTFGKLISAQALGDLTALSQRGRRVLGINLGANAGDGLAKVLDALK